MIEYIKEIKRLSINKLAFEIKKTYDECGIEKTNHIYKEYLVFKTLFGYDKELYLNNSKNIELNDIKEQLQEEMI